MRTLLGMLFLLACWLTATPIVLFPASVPTGPESVDIPYPFFPQAVIESVWKATRESEYIGVCYYATVERVPRGSPIRIKGISVQNHTYWLISDAVPFSANEPEPYCSGAVGVGIFDLGASDEDALARCVEPMRTRDDLAFYMCVTGFTRVPNPAADMRRYVDPDRLAPGNVPDIPLTLLRMDGPGVTLLTDWGMCRFARDRKYCKAPSVDT